MRKTLTKEQCKLEALKYTNKKDFRTFSKSAYDKASLNGWLKEISGHLIAAKNGPTIKWTLEALKIEALKYNTRTKFYNGNPSAYGIALNNKMLDEICSHMIKNFISWTKELCHIESLKYTSRIEFQRNCPNGYDAAIKRLKCLDEICSHMTKSNMLDIPRLIYAYEFSDNSVYVGLTWNLKERQKWRKLTPKDSVTKYINQTGLIPEIKILSELIPAIDAQKLEIKVINDYKQNGWNILNRSAGGNLGGSMRYNKPSYYDEESISATDDAGF